MLWILMLCRMIDNSDQHVDLMRKYAVVIRVEDHNWHNVVHDSIVHHLTVSLLELHISPAAAPLFTQSVRRQHRDADQNSCEYRESGQERKIIKGNDVHAY